MVERALLAPIYHWCYRIKKEIELPYSFLNIEEFLILRHFTFTEWHLFMQEIGPGNCIDKWIRENSNFNYDKDGDEKIWHSE